jgi:hypothetical protein
VDMNTRTLRQSFGFVLVMDGLAGLFWPTRYLRKLQIGAATYDDMLDYLAERPSLTRKLCVAEIAVGTWLALR